MGRKLAREIFVDRQAKVHCPICDKFLDEDFKVVTDNQYGNVWICNNHNTKLGG